MNYFVATIYGILQGLTEFFPVSSSGHLALLPKFLSTSDPGVAFDLMMHVGTALAVCIYYRHTLLSLLLHLFPALFPKFPVRPSFELKQESIFLVRNLLLATVATLPLVFLFKGVASGHARQAHFIALNLVVFGLFLWLTDYLGNKQETQQMQTSHQLKKSILIGVAQSLAIFPGVSRSGITIGMARLLKLSRKEAADFSFILSLPIILGGALEKLPALLLSTTPFPWSECLYAMLVSFVVGYLAIHFFIRLVERWGLWTFAIYRTLLAIIVLVL